ncbi:GtrA family protein [Leisingera sp. HS039]|uniref:GtrA family protein n=1 Tax=unclassified Leisingera TaxID=2614906 RepID=UPI001070B7DE|nr:MULTISPECIES: GtrA family protein [unclassified Leisingera]MBQ4826155.1 GtrA family protein [Leisingera sp. HS039]QBR38624.1 GtrA family protein [Leisingera sp. NJS201]
MTLPSQLLRYSSVGVLATLAHYGAGSAGLLAGFPPLSSNLLGFACGFTVGFAGHHRFTFRKKTAGTLRPLFRYAAVSCGSFAGGQALLSAFAASSGPPAFAELLLALVFAAAINLLLSSQWAFT